MNGAVSKIVICTTMSAWASFVANAHEGVFELFRPLHVDALKNEVKRGCARQCVAPAAGRRRIQAVTRTATRVSVGRMPRPISMQRYVLNGQRAGFNEVDDGPVVTFMHYDLGYINFRQEAQPPLGQPVRELVVPSRIPHASVDRTRTGDKTR
jgi:hypothetical protein